jgi:hypothetical protein
LICLQCRDDCFKKKVNSCPFCKQTNKLERKNRHVNNLLSQVIFNCSYSKEGCKQQLPYEKIKQHEEECRKFKCGKCPFECEKKDTAEAKEHDCIRYLNTEFKKALELIKEVQSEARKTALEEQKKN